MNMEDIVREVLEELDVPLGLTNAALMFATLAMPNSRGLSQRELPPDDAELMRWYFRWLIHRLATEPKFRKQLRKEMQEKIERN